MKQQNNWRNELRNRSITPSDEAWLAIESGLENKSKNKLKKKFIFSLVAASLIGFVVFVSLPTNSTQQQSQAATTEEFQPTTEESVFPEALFLEIESTLSSVAVEANEQDEVAKPQISTPLDTASKESNNNLETETASTKYVTKSQEETPQNAKVNQKAIQLLAEVEAELAGNSSTNLQISAEDEADLLLAEAKQIIKEVEYNQLYDFAKASDLLAEVENDLSKDNLQNRVWHFVKANYENLESALVSLK